jgi:predicted nucleic-acid-binding protein
MTAIDTNVLLRIITRDNHEQAERAVAFLDGQERIFLAKTVLLEVEWVLRSTYKYARGEVLSALRAFVSLTNAEVEDAAAVAQAIDWYEQGLDFADSLHIASAGHQSTFASFDAALQRAALRLRIAKVITP